MGFIDKVKSYLRGGYYPPTRIPYNRIEYDQNGVPTFWPLNFGSYQYQERNFDEFVQNGYGRNPYIFMVIDRIATLAKNIPVKVCDSEGEEIEVPEWNSLCKKTNEKQNWESFFYASLSQWLATGNAIMWGTSPIGSRDYMALNLAFTQNVEIQTESGELWGVPKAYHITNQFGATSIEADRVLHLRKPNIINDDNFGLSPLYAGQPVYTASNNTFTAQATVHENRGATGIISPKSGDDVLSQSEQDQLQMAWDSRNTGAEKMGKNKVTTIPMDFTQIGMSATDLKLVEMSPIHLRNACALFSVPSILFGDVAGTTFNNMKEAKQSIYNDAVLPLSNDFYNALSYWLLQDNWGYEGAYFMLDTSEIGALQKDLSEEHDRVRADVQAGLLTAQEAREILYPEMGQLNEQGNE